MAYNTSDLQAIDLATMPMGFNTVIPEFFIKIHTAIEAVKNTDGLYRKPGNQKKTKDLYSEVLNGVYNFDENTEPHVLTSVYKKVIMQLKKPLISLEAINIMRSANSLNEGDEKDSMFADALMLLDTRNAKVLYELFKHLNVISDASIENKMPADNLAKMFAGSLFTEQSKEVQTLDQRCTATAVAAKILLYLMQNYTKLFLIANLTPINMHNMPTGKGVLIPQFFAKIISAIEAQKITSGIYSKPDNMTECRRLFINVFHGVYNFDKTTDPHSLTALLKRVIKSLEEPLIPLHVFQKMKEANILRKDDKKVVCYKDALNLLDAKRFNLLFELFKHLNVVANASDQNQMTHTVLASVFAVTLLGHYHVGLVGDVNDLIDITQKIILYLIQNHMKIFEKHMV